MADDRPTRRLWREHIAIGTRVCWLFWYAGPLALSFARDRRRWITRGAPVTRTERFHRERARQLVHALAQLGPTYVKLAQIFSTRADLVPEPYLSALATLTDRVPPVPWATLRPLVDAAWGRPATSVVDALDPTPLAAGSLGQVHRARFAGEEVVVKVLRPRVADVVRRDIAVARAVVDWMYARFPHHHVLGFRVVLDEFAVHVFEEMDFVREAEQATRMRERFADERRLRIPRVVASLTRPDVLVLEYIAGTRIDQLDARLADGSVDHERLVATLIESYARMMLRDGVFHADPHPGNLLVDADGRLVLLDFGMVIDVDVATRKALFETIIAAIRRDAAGTSRGFYALNMVAPGTAPETMEALVASLLEIAYSSSDVVERSRMLAERVMQELFAWPVVLPGELVYFARTAMLIEGVGTRYDPTFNSIRVASPIVLRLRRELLVALAGTAGDQETIVRWAALLGAFAGGAAAVMNSPTLRSEWATDLGTTIGRGIGRFRDALRARLDAPPATAVSSATPAAESRPRLKDPLPKEIEAELHPRKHVAAEP
jgi:predicted unusual protein kinase regulating ubiquinone biosynthesis (AarF/ABC1/UbiB family)